MELVGVDGCRGGWLCVRRTGSQIDAFVASSFAQLLASVAHPRVIAIDIPIGLTVGPARLCDLEARRLLGRKRGTSVFPAPVRQVLPATSYLQACQLAMLATGRRLSKQSFAILQKICEVDAILAANPGLQMDVCEVHPEVCFWRWSGGRAMAGNKKRPAGRAARELLVDEHWPGVRQRLTQQLAGCRYQPDDLNDAFAALWTAERIDAKIATRIPTLPPVDVRGLRMEMWI